MEEIVNKVAKSGLITLDLSTWLADESFIEIDLAPLLWQGLVLREDEFRDWIKNHDCSQACMPKAEQWHQ